MPTDATGAPTPLGIPKYNVAVDAPSGIGNNNTMDALDTIIGARVPSPAGIASGEVPVWNGSAWVRSSVTPIGSSSLVNAPAGTPTGAVMQFSAASAPTGWVLCDGSAIARGGSNAALFALISTTYGVGDGSTTFNVPDFRGRMVVGMGTHTDVDTLGENDGVAVGSRRPKHAHGASGLVFTGTNANTGTESVDHTHGVSSGGGFWVWANAGGGTTSTTGGNNTLLNTATSGRSAAHTHNYTPSGTISGTVGQTGMTDSAGYLVMNYIIKL